MLTSATDPENTRVIVGMSGGVDSSVAALLLVRQGYQVSGIFMQNWEDDDEQCTARQDYRDAAGVAERLGIALTTVNFADEYWQRVFAHFLDEYRAGRTPNPDILCNREIKFKAFLDHARHQGADFIATGHYARTDRRDGQARLLRGLDRNKDQSYFLHAIGHRQVDATLFPVGDIEKAEVRRLAREAGLHVHGKKDSTGICFIGERKFSAFLAEYLPAQGGEIVTETGKVVGRHNGLMFYTLGQRQGIGIGGRQDASDSPWYVLDKDLEHNRLLVGQGHDHPRLLRQRLAVHDMHWISGQAPGGSFRCGAKIRYRQSDVDTTVDVIDDRHITLTFDSAVRAATPGQSAVLYDGDVCLGGGIISDL